MPKPTLDQPLVLKCHNSSNNAFSSTPYKSTTQYIPGSTTGATASDGNPNPCNTSAVPRFYALLIIEILLPTGRRVQSWNFSTKTCMSIVIIKCIHHFPHLLFSGYINRTASTHSRSESCCRSASRS